MKQKKMWFANFFLLFVWSSVEAGRRTRIRVLKTPEEKVRFLNFSRVAKENFFFGMRPILYVSRYSCNCPNSEGTDTGSPSSSILDLPDFPEDEVIPPSFSDSMIPPRLQDHQQGLPSLGGETYPSSPGSSSSPSSKIKEIDKRML